MNMYRLFGLFRSWLKPLAMSSFMFGVMIGAVVLGWLSDLMGRKFTVFLTLFFMIVFNELGVLCYRLVMTLIKYKSI